MGIFSVTSTVHGSDGQSVYFALDLAGVETVEEFADILAEDGLVVGTRLQVRKDQQGRTVLHEGKETLVTLAGVATAVRSYDLDDAKRISRGGR